ncbi:esterase/lipase family protein [Micromonospora chalcea]
MTAVDVLGGVHVIPGVWSPVVGYRRLVRWLRQRFSLDPTEAGRPGNLVVFPYDWRLSNRYNAAQLERVVVPALKRWREAGHPQAQLVFICHSMGGLVVRYFLETLGGAAICRSLVTMGTPYRGSLPALRYLVDGLRVKDRELTRLTALARSLPSLHQLAPTYACVDQPDGLRYLRDVSIEGPDAALLTDADAFHREISDGVRDRGDTNSYEIHPIIGFAQPTPTVVRPDGDGYVWSNEIDGHDEGGDGRVPFLSGIPAELQGKGPRERAHLQAHGALPDDRGVREGIEFALTQVRRFHRGPNDPKAFGVQVPEMVPPGQPFEVSATAASEELALAVTIADAYATGSPSAVTMVNRGHGRYTHAVEGLPPGLYQVTVAPRGGGQPVTTHLLVWDGQDG